MKIQNKSGSYKLTGLGGLMPLFGYDNSIVPKLLGSIVTEASRSYFTAYCPVIPRSMWMKDRVSFELLGWWKSGPMISIIGPNYFILCEVVTDECVGSTSKLPYVANLIEIRHIKRGPLARRRQAAKLASWKLIDDDRRSSASWEKFPYGFTAQPSQ